MNSTNFTRKNDFVGGKGNFVSIKYKLMILIGILTSVVIFTLTIISVQIAQKAVMSKVEDHLISEAHSKAKIIDISIQNDFVRLETVASMPMFKDESISNAEKARRLAEDMSKFLNMFFCDNQGNLYMPNGDVHDISFREYYKIAMKGQSYITEPYKDIFGKFRISAVSPIFDDNKKVIGAVIGDLGGFALNKHIEDIVIGENGYCYILDNNGSVIAHKTKKLVLNANNAQNLSKKNKNLVSLARFEAEATASKRSSIGFYDYEGSSNIASFAKIPSTGWTVIVKAPVKEFLGTVDRLRFWIIFIGFLILVVALVITFFLSNRISRPVEKVTSTLKRISLGNLKNVKDEVNSNDEIGILSSALFNMVEKLSSIVSEVNHNSDNIAKVSSHVKDASLELSQGANEQATSTEEVSSTMEEMKVNISHNADSATSTEKIAIESNKGIASVGKKAREATEAHLLINEKITIINELSAQTNLLALNAAIEAARAGEHGKGFAVVAAEVRKLAERSKAAAQEIIDLSSNAQKLSDNAEESLSKIVPAIDKTAQLVKNIAAASSEQRIGVDQVNNAIQQLSTIAQQNAAKSENLAATSEEMTAQAEQLRELISYFKVD